VIGILHIGAEKTGTTTLQQFCLLNRERLAAAGVLYPRSPGAGQHGLLSVYAMDETRENLQTRRMGEALAQGRAPWRDALVAKLSAEIGQAAAGRVLFSSELLHSQLRNVEEIARLKDLLDAWCDSYRVVFYMRRQDKAQVSRYSTDLRAGGTPAALLPPCRGARDLYAYAEVLDRWSAVFGRESMVPRVFEAAAWPDRDLIADFLEACGLPAMPDALRPSAHNEALSATAQGLLLAYNRSRASLPPLPDGGDGRLQRAVVAYLEQSCPGPPSLPSRAEALAFHEAFRAGNDAVARTWFGRDRLFDEDFSHYPEQADALRPPEGADAMALASGLAHYLMAQAVWLDDQRLHRLSHLNSERSLPRVLAEYLRERSAALADRVAAWSLAGHRG
jgi:hypothetical protein